MTKLIKCVFKFSIEIVISTESRLGSQHHEGDEAARRWGVGRQNWAIAGRPSVSGKGKRPARIGVGDRSSISSLNDRSNGRAIAKPRSFRKAIAFPV
ncbi:hypothetical protein JJD41_22620 [Oxynema sp. CENA135]|uniref:hypothetical protein n=1 Tax=Oxynema sp. CENA135 TaxID=984206 RepID=UPI0019092608|nr:hypothetical protein [Oxynema sp. CENA135]MBK4732638.1 hypothetical protein [Oxynema sp. CENA135]